MALWILRPLDTLEPEHWLPWYDKCFGMVVRAATADEARVLASRYAADEGARAWLDATLSSCVALTDDGVAEVVLVDVRHG